MATVATIPDVTPLSYLSSTPKEQLLRREQPETLLGFLEPKAEMDPKGSERISWSQKLLPARWILFCTSAFSEAVQEKTSVWSYMILKSNAIQATWPGKNFDVPAGASPAKAPVTLRAVISRSITRSDVLLLKPMATFDSFRHFHLQTLSVLGCSRAPKGCCEVPAPDALLTECALAAPFSGS